MLNEKPLKISLPAIKLNKPLKLYDTIRLKAHLPKKDALREHLKNV
jgi:hypothetical protein